MVLLQQPLVVRIVKVAHRHGVHVEETEVGALGVQEAVGAALRRHNVRQIQAIFEAKSSQRGKEQRQGEGEEDQGFDWSPAEQRDVVGGGEVGGGQLERPFSLKLGSFNLGGAFRRGILLFSSCHFHH